MDTLKRLFSKSNLCCSSAHSFHLDVCKQLVVVAVPNENLNLPPELSKDLVRALKTVYAKHRENGQFWNVSHLVDLPKDFVRMNLLSRKSNFSAPSHAPEAEVYLRLVTEIDSWLHLSDNPDHSAHQNGGGAFAVIVVDECRLAVLSAVLAHYFSPPASSSSSSTLLPALDQRARYLAYCDEYSRKKFSSVRPLKSHEYFIDSWQSRFPQSPSIPAVASALAHNNNIGLKLETLTISGIPKISSGGFKPFFLIIKNDEIVFSSMTLLGGPRTISKSHTYPVNISLKGDFVLRLYHIPASGPGKILFSYTLSTMMLSSLSPTLSVCADNVDDLNTLEGSVSYSGDFTVTLSFGLESSSSLPSSSSSPPNQQQQQHFAAPRHPPHPSLLLASPSTPVLPPPGGSHNPSQASNEDLNDEELARRLQEEFDMEYVRAMNPEDQPDALSSDDSDVSVRIPPLREPRRSAEDQMMISDLQLAQQMQSELFLEEMLRESGNPDLTSLLLRHAGITPRLANSESVMALPIGSISPQTKATHKQCEICFEEYEDGDSFRTLPCLHIYHVHCIDRWLSQKAACPICLHSIDENPE